MKNYVLDVLDVFKPETLSIEGLNDRYFVKVAANERPDSSVNVAVLVEAQKRPVTYKISFNIIADIINKNYMYTVFIDTTAFKGALTTKLDVLKKSKKISDVKSIDEFNRMLRLSKPVILPTTPYTDYSDKNRAERVMMGILDEFRENFLEVVGINLVQRIDAIIEGIIGSNESIKNRLNNLIEDMR